LNMIWCWVEIFTEVIRPVRNASRRLVRHGRKLPVKTGEVSVTYSSGTSSASMAVSTDLTYLAETDFGLRLLSLIKHCSWSVYVP